LAQKVIGMDVNIEGIKVLTDKTLLFTWVEKKN
jgi:hypothetical protein